MRKHILITGMACTSMAMAANSPVTVKDDLTSVTVPSKPNRIIAAHPIALELLLALGTEPMGYVVAPQGTNLGNPIQNVPKYNDLLKTHPVYLGNPLNLEATAALKPDLIIAPNRNDADIERQVRCIAPTLMFNLALGDGWQRAIVPLGKVLGREKRAQEVLNSIKKRENLARTLLAPVAGKGKKVVIFGIIGNDLVAMGAEFTASKQLQRLGFEVQSPVTGTWKTVSAESMLTTKADRALLLTYNPQPEVEKSALSFLRRGGFKSIHTFSPDNVGRFTTGPLSDVQMLNHLVEILSKPGIQ